MAYTKIKGQCNGAWSDTTSYNYLCANGPYSSYDLGANVCPTSAQNTYNFSAPVPAVELNFSAFGTASLTGQSRMAIFLNGTKIDLASACQISVGCQNPSGNYSVNGGCLVDFLPGSDGGISGTIILKASAFSLTSINSIGYAISEPGSSGTIFEVMACNTTCVETNINELKSHFSVSLIPNPSTKEIIITFPNNSASYLISILKSDGNKVKQTEVENLSYLSLNKNEFGDGIFFLIVQDKMGSIFRSKFIFN